METAPSVLEAIGMPTTHSLAPAIILMVMMAGVITALMWEVWTFLRQQTIIPKGRFIWRVIGLILLLTILSGMFAGLYLIRFPDRLAFFRYWSIFLTFALVTVIIVVAMALRDWLWLMREQFQRKVDLYQKLGEELRQLAQKTVGGEDGSQGDR